MRSATLYYLDTVIGRLTDEPEFYVINDMSNEILLTEMESICYDVKHMYDFDLDKYADLFIGKLHFEKD